MVPLTLNKPKQHTTTTNHAKEAKEHCVRFAVVIYEGRKRGEKGERGGARRETTKMTLLPDSIFTIKNGFEHS